MFSDGFQSGREPRGPAWQQLLAGSLCPWVQGASWDILGDSKSLPPQPCSLGSLETYRYSRTTLAEVSAQEVLHTP